MVPMSPSPSLRRRKTLRKAAESAPLGDSSGAPHLFLRNVQVMQFCMTSSVEFNFPKLVVTLWRCLHIIN